MIAAFSPPAPALPGSAALSALIGAARAARIRLAARDMLAAALIVLSASAIVYAEERLQDWIPEVLVFPDDTEVVKDRAIGATVRMLSITTDADIDTLFAAWEESLRENGYPLARSDNELLNGSIEFSGPGIANAKIILSPTAYEGQSLIEFDATLR